MPNFDIFITELETGERLRLPMLPESVSESAAAKTVSFDTILVGEVAHPRGMKLVTYEWSGTLPGTAGATYIYDWQPPSAIIQRLKRYRDEGRVLRLMVTGAPVNDDVFITDFKSEWSGGAGDVQYRIALKQYRRVVVQTTEEAGLVSAGGQSTTIETEQAITYNIVNITTPKSGGYSRIYKSAKTSSSVLKKLKNAQEVLVLDDTSKSKFTKVKYDSKTGWMLKADLAFSRSEIITTTTVVTDVVAS